MIDDHAQKDHVCPVTGSLELPNGPPTIRGLPLAQAKRSEQKKREVMRQAVESVKEAVRAGRFLLSLHYPEDGRLQHKAFRANFDEADFMACEQHLRSFLSSERLKRDAAGGDNPEVQELDEVLGELENEPSRQAADDD